MHKIPSVYQRNYQGDRLVRNEVIPGCEWVANGEGVATRKLDGTCCLIRDGKFFKRCEVKPLATPPIGFEPAGDVDEVTGKQQGWIPVGDSPDDRWHREGLQHSVPDLRDGTYELIGPKIQGNPEKAEFHQLHSHSAQIMAEEPPREFQALKEFLSARDIEGIVWHHPDGRMAKIKTKDFGLKRKTT